MLMVVLDGGIFCGGNIASHLFRKKKSRSCSNVNVALAKKNNSSENSTADQQPISNRSFLAQFASGVFALGFVDAGYSGDWSRIGAISKETEDGLRVAAFLVVPFCLFLVFWLSKKSDD